MQTEMNTACYEGQVIEVEEPLKGDRDGRVLGHGVRLAQMGRSIRFFISSKFIDKPELGQTIAVAGRLEAAPSGWPKFKATGAEVTS